MIEILHDIFIAVLYIFGIGLFGSFAAFFYALIVGLLRKSRHHD